ncbi:MAG: chromate transporter [Stellaceae bacterium]
MRHRVESLPDERDGAPPAPPGLAGIFLAFFRLGCTSFGGGTAGWLYRDIVLRRGWIENQAFLSMLAVGQALPGANGVKATVQIGQHLRGALGAAVALFGLLSGPFVIILAVGAAYRGLGTHPLVQAVLDGMAAAAIGLTFDTGLRSASHGARRPAAIAITATTVLCVGVLRWPMFPVILGLAPLSIGAALVEPRPQPDA